MGEIKSAYTILSVNLKGRDNLEDPGENGRILLKRILQKYDEDVNSIHLDQDRGQ
jgi:hypothetical protein